MPSEGIGVELMTHQQLWVGLGTRVTVVCARPEAADHGYHVSAAHQLMHPLTARSHPALV